MTNHKGSDRMCDRSTSAAPKKLAPKILQNQMYNSRDRKAMTPRDARFYAFFPPGNRAISPHFVVIS